MLNGDGFTGSEDSEGALLSKVDGSLGRVLDLHAAELGDSAGVLLSDGESLSGHLAEGAERVVEELQGLVTGVGNGSLDFEVVDTINSLRARDLEGESRGSRDCDSGGREGDQSGANRGGEHG